MSTSRNVKHPVRIALATAIAAALVPLGLSTADAATTTPAATHMAPSHASAPHSARPTIVLVHGAWADGSSWSGEVRRLKKDGYQVRVAPNPLRGLSSDAKSLRAYLSTVSGPVILVGHSYGGAVITAAATGNANVKGLVYVDAYLPDQGQDISTLSTEKSALAPATVDPASVFRLQPIVGQDAYDTYLLPRVFFSDFAPDVPMRKAHKLEADQAATATTALGEPLSGVPAWQSIPSYDLVGTRDRIIPEEAQLAMARHAKAKVEYVRSSHLSPVSHPSAVTNIIERAAREQGGRAR